MSLKICPFNGARSSQKRNVSFSSKVVYQAPSDVFTSEQKDYIDKFEENPDRTEKFLGEGVTSKAYYSDKYNFVIKENKANPYVPIKNKYQMGSLGHENAILLSIDPRVKTTQRGIGYAETEKGGKFLFSTFVPGKPSDRISNPFRAKHIDRLLRNLYRLDRSGIIHSDLSRPNLLLNYDDNVNIIDYQWGDKVNLNYKFSNFSLENSTFPSFEAPNNAAMFESAALPGYTRGLSKQEGKDFLENYFQNKAYYVGKNVRRLESINQDDPYIHLNEIIDFELAKKHAYENLNDDVLQAEALKMNILNLHRRQYSCYDVNKIDPRNILRAIPLCIEGKACADKLSNFEYAKGGENDKYFEYMKKYGSFWQEKMDGWYTPALKWMLKLVTGEEKDPAKIYFPDKLQDFGNLGVLNLDTKTASSNKLIDFENTAYSETDKLLREKYLSAHRSGFCSYSNETEINSVIRKVLSLKR